MSEAGVTQAATRKGLLHNLFSNYLGLSDPNECCVRRGGRSERTSPLFRSRPPNASVTPRATAHIKPTRSDRTARVSNELQGTHDARDVQNPTINLITIDPQILLICAFAAYASAKPTVLAAPLVAAAPVVTATSSQYYHRINNGLAAYVAAPAAYVAAPAAAYVAAPASYVAAAPAAPIVAI
ncbi:hypothetical protein EVAR_28326_1 [Eumeta japonica]|uniref:Uncharacterized protein n=1 Tax=Eumeta variegata TaxID=151549 RepID=A0A4C1VA19_EUMVA|nr:hypothetical protein EVAR_28326_1 [Eumeta japonica]